MPRAHQDALSASSLYLQKNDANESIVWEVVTANVMTLIEPRTSWSVVEHLGCVQALIIFKIIRLFDGDIKQRSDAEQQEELLVIWTESLAQRTAIIMSSPRTAGRSWEDWIFDEVVSRTIIVSLIAQAMFSIQKQGFCTLVNAVTSMSFTAQTKLWLAPSAIHWIKTCQADRNFWIEKMELGEMMEKAAPEELDELAWLILVTYKGIDGANSWIVSKGGLTLLE